MERLSPLDASFLHLEDDRSHMHIGSVAIFEGPPAAYDEMLARIGGKLPLVPRYRQKVRFVPLALGRPVWVDDPHFQLRYHVRRTALPRPGGDEELRLLVGRVMSQQLDRARPLWEMWIVEGLSENRWAMVSKVHHCMVDGVSGTDLLKVLLDEDPAAERPPYEAWEPGPEPGSARLLVESLAERAVSPYEGVRSVRATLRAPRQLAARAEGTARGLVALRGLVRRTEESSLNGPIGPHRRWEWARSRLSDVKTVRAGLGGTVNDVVLAVITNGFRELLLSRGETVERELRTMVPVSVRAPHERGTYNNRVSAMFANLPVEIEDPVERLAAVKRQMEGLKESRQAVAGEVLVSLSGFAPEMLLALGLRVATRTPQRNVNTVTTNVPGPQQPLFAAGRRMLESFPYVPLAGHVRIGLAIFSYDGALNFGVTGDYDTAADIGVLCRGIEDGMAVLVKEAAKQGKRNGRKAPKPKAKAAPRAPRKQPA
jgi:diacylglycerol O-acyltransferase